jgi:hypothetical protein
MAPDLIKFVYPNSRVAAYAIAGPDLRHLLTRRVTLVSNSVLKNAVAGHGTKRQNCFSQNAEEKSRFLVASLLGMTTFGADSSRTIRPRNDSVGPQKEARNGF